jgi:hypothetical protein
VAIVDKGGGVGGRGIRNGLSGEECAEADGVRVLRDDMGEFSMVDSALE